MKIQLHSDSLRVGRTPASLRLRARRAWLRAALAVLAAQSFAAAQASAAVTEAWVQRYSNVGDSIDQAFKILRDAAGDFLVVGATADQFAVQGMVIIKYSGADGSVLWQKRYDGPAAILISGFAMPAFLAAVDASGNLVVTTRADSNNNDYYTAKYAAADGALLWERRYDGPAHGSDIPSAVAVDGSGNVVVTGSSRIGFDPLGNRDYPADYYTAKYAAANGALLWEKRYDGPAQGWDYAMSVAVDASGNVVVTGGSSNETEINDLPYDFNYYTVKYAAADGALLWEKRYGGPADEEFAQAVAVDGSGNVVVTGYSYTPNSSSSDYYTVKYAAADGAFLWEKRYDGPAHKLDVPRAVVVDSIGNVVVTGYSNNGSGSDPSLRNDYYTAKYAAANGALLWENRYNGPANDDELPMALAVDAGSNVVVTGYSYGLSSKYDFYTAKYAAADGALLWDKRFNGPTNGDDIAQGLAVDASGDVVVTGYSNYDFYTARYAAVNGALLWDNRYSGQSNRDDQAKAVAVDGAGNVVVTGYSYGGGAGSLDYYTARYAAADGALLWEKRGVGGNAVVVDASGNVVVTGAYGTNKYLADGTMVWTSAVGAGILALDTSGNVLTGRAKYGAADGALLWETHDANVSPTDVAVDPSGNMVVTGSTYPHGTDPDFYTAKYAAATGALLWAKRYNGPLDSDDLAVAVAVDGAGNVVVSGGSIVNTYTAKYAAATGALLWEKYGADATGGDYLEDMAVDASGNVVVTVSSYDINFRSDYYTAKYAAADGALLWEKRYNGPANGDDRPRAAAVDAGGNVVVTGQSANSGWRDYYTAAYAAADGALLWEKRYNGPANGDDFMDGSHSLALGPNGMVAITGASDGAFSSYFQAYDYATVVYRVLPPPVSFAAWAASFELSSGAAAADADPDHDGLPNGVEYVFGGNPTVPAASASGSPTVTSSGGNMAFTFLRPEASETPDVTLTVEASTDLERWPASFTIGPDTAASSPGVTISENGTAPDTITVAIPVGTGKTKFARLKVTIAP